MQHVRCRLKRDNTCELFGQPIAYQGIHTMARRAESSQLYPLGVLNLLGVAVAPFHRNLAVGVGIHEDVECAVTIELREERHGCCDLSKNRGDLSLDFRLGLLPRRRT